MPCHLPKISSLAPVLLRLGSHFLVTPIHSILPHRPCDLVNNYVITWHDDWRTDLSIAVVQLNKEETVAPAARRSLREKTLRCEIHTGEIRRCSGNAP